jgi:hypothetical protein
MHWIYRGIRPVVIAGFLAACSRQTARCAALLSARTVVMTSPQRHGPSNRGTMITGHESAAVHVPPAADRRRDARGAGRCDWRRDARSRVRRDLARRDHGPADEGPEAARPGGGEGRLAVLGIDLANRIPEGAYGVTEFVVRTSMTIRHALSAMSELAPLVNPALDMRYVADQLGCEVRFSYAGNRDALGELLNEYTVAYIAKQFALILQHSLPLTRAWFAHGRRTGVEEVAKRLGCPVGFQAADCGFARRRRRRRAGPRVTDHASSQPRPVERSGGERRLAAAARSQYPDRDARGLVGSDRCRRYELGPRRTVRHSRRRRGQGAVEANRHDDRRKSEVVVVARARRA